MTKQTTKFYGDPQNQSVNIISEATLIKGNIAANGDIRIDGALLGDINAKGRLVIGPKGKVDGEINCNSIEVSGYIKGKVTVSDLFAMKATAQIDGDITVGKLSVEPGSLFTGNCLMGNPKLKNETQRSKEKTEV